MLTVLNWIIDAVFPPRKTERLVREISTDIVLSLCEPRTFSNHFFLCNYENKIVKALITENKYHQNERSAKLLGITLNKWLAQRNDKLLFIPIPLGSIRRKERGYNQVTEVLKTISNINIATDLLIRAKETAPQTSLQKAERLRNVRTVFVCSDPALLSQHIGKTILR
jgi:predicted amidophosphoribosyltransferase